MSAILPAGANVGSPSGHEQHEEGCENGQRRGKGRDDAGDDWPQLMRDGDQQEQDGCAFPTMQHQPKPVVGHLDGRAFRVTKRLNSTRQEDADRKTRNARREEEKDVLSNGQVRRTFDDLMSNVSDSASGDSNAPEQAVKRSDPTVPRSWIRVLAPFKHARCAMRLNPSHSTTDATRNPAGLAGRRCHTLAIHSFRTFQLSHFLTFSRSSPSHSASSPAAAPCSWNGVCTLPPGNLSPANSRWR